jgi:hypothetical protein
LTVDASSRFAESVVKYARSVCWKSISVDFSTSHGVEVGDYFGGVDYEAPNDGVKRRLTLAEWKGLLAYKRYVLKYRCLPCWTVEGVFHLHCGNTT